MKTSIQMLDAMKIRIGVESDYALAKRAGFTKSFVSSIRQGRSGWGDESGLIIARILNEDPGYILGLLHAERAKDASIKSVWEKIAATFARPLSVALCVVFLALETLSPRAAMASETALHNASYSASTGTDYKLYVYCNKMFSQKFQSSEDQ